MSKEKDIKVKQLKQPELKPKKLPEVGSASNIKQYQIIDQKVDNINKTDYKNPSIIANYMECLKSKKCRKKQQIFILCILLLFVAFYTLNNQDIKLIETLMQLTIGFVIFCYIYQKKTSIEDIITLVIIIGCIMRLGYTLYTPITVRSHDFGGHMRYITTLYNGSLPIDNYVQNYHPPLFHALVALFGRIFGILKYEGEDIFEAGKLISCFASCVMLYVTKKIGEELRLSQRTVLIAVILTAFLPNFYLLAGRLNNDSLSIMFIYLAILYTIRWYSKPTYKSIIIIALAIGFGMMTKISVAIMAFVTGPVMLYVLYRDYKVNKSNSTILNQLIVFGIICFPLGLWYPIRNKILFDQPFNYVLRQSEEMSFFLGNDPISIRFFDLPFKAGLESIYNDPWHDKNIWIYILKGALFGEFTFDVNVFISRLLLITYFIISIISVIVILHLIIANNISILAKYMLGMVWLITMVSFISINISIPFGCTMDYRYIVPTCLTGSYSLGILYDRNTISTEDIKSIGSIQIFDKITRRVMEFLLLLFVMCSMIMFTTINS